MCGALNLFIGSASTKWSILASVFVPMFMLMGYSPALVQMAYRIGDAFTNPMNLPHLSPTSACCWPWLRSMTRRPASAP